MTEWLELMLAEVRRKQAEQAEAEAEKAPDVFSATAPGTRATRRKNRFDPVVRPEKL